MLPPRMKSGRMRIPKCCGATLSITRFTAL